MIIHANRLDCNALKKMGNMQFIFRVEIMVPLLTNYFSNFIIFNSIMRSQHFTDRDLQRR